MLENKVEKQMQTISFNPPIKLSEQDKWLLSVSNFEATNSVSNITDENNSFSISIPGYRKSESAEKTIDERKNLLKLASEIDIELCVGEVRKRGQQIKIADKDYKLSDLGTHIDKINIILLFISE